MKNTKRKNYWKAGAFFITAMITIAQPVNAFWGDIDLPTEEKEDVELVDENIGSDEEDKIVGKWNVSYMVTDEETYSLKSTGDIVSYATFNEEGIFEVSLLEGTDDPWELSGVWSRLTETEKAKIDEADDYYAIYEISICMINDEVTYDTEVGMLRNGDDIYRDNNLIFGIGTATLLCSKEETEVEQEGDESKMADNYLANSENAGVTGEERDALEKDSEKYDTYEDALKAYVEACFEADAEKLLSLLPEDYVEKVLIKERNLTKEEYTRKLEESLKEDIAPLNESNSKWDYSYEIVSVNELSDTELQEETTDYKENSGLDIVFKNGVDIMLKLSVEINGTDNNIECRTIRILQAEDSWYTDWRGWDNLSFDIECSIEDLNR